jgi:uncharacterized protein YdhG (YjbR/CyaY superfamily)
VKRVSARNVSEYIALCAPQVRARLEQIRETVRRAAPDALERISYGIPTFSQHGNLVHFAAYEHHVGFYPGASAIASFAKQLPTYATSKGTVQLPLDRPVPLELVAKIVRFRVAEDLERHAAKIDKRGTRKNRPKR